MGDNIVEQTKSSKSLLQQEITAELSTSQEQTVSYPHVFYSQEDKVDRLNLNLVLEYMPETVHFIQCYRQKSKIAILLYT